MFCQLSLLKGVQEGYQEGYTAQAAHSLGFSKPPAPTSRLVRCAVPARKHYVVLVHTCTPCMEYIPFINNIGNGSAGRGTAHVLRL